MRPSGANLIVMRDPEGNEFPNRGIYLEVVENGRLVFPDAYTEAWPPRGQRRLFVSRRPSQTTSIHSSTAKSISPLSEETGM